jgi:hypothetical protein
MQTKIALAFVTALTSVSLGSIAHAKTVDKQKFKGSQTATSFTVDEALTCADGTSGSVFASGFLSGSDSISKETGTPKTTSNGVFVELDIYSNTCTGVNFNFGDGGIPNGYTPPNKNLNSAGLMGTASVQDFDTSKTIAIVIDLVVEGTGPITASKSHSHTRTVQTPGGPITINIDSSANSNRSGDVSGTLSIDGTEFDATYSSTTLSTNATMEITISKN